VVKVSGDVGDLDAGAVLADEGLLRTGEFHGD
jgi:hypothetical protein